MRVANIQRFCMHDGPGVRTTVFLKGCPLRCVWCHNIETQSAQSEILFYRQKCIGCAACFKCGSGAHIFKDAHIFDRTKCIFCGYCTNVCPTNALELIGKEFTPKELYEEIQKDVAFYSENGGVTLSGGEPLMQIEEVIKLLRLCKENGIHTAIETCGYFSPDFLPSLVEVTDLFLWDIKDTHSKRHQKYTGVPNEKIIDNLILADSLGAKTRIRCILISGVNTNEEHYKNIAEIYHRLKNCEGVEFIPYHCFGGAKAIALDKEISANDSWIPSKEQITFAKEFLLKDKVTVF